MRLRETICVALGAAVLSLAFTAAAAAEEGAGGPSPRLSAAQFEAIDPVFEALIPVGRKNQAAALTRRALRDMGGRCRALDRRDPLQKALRHDCITLVDSTRVVMRINRCVGFKGCGALYAKASHEFGRSRLVARRSNAIYRRELRGRCLGSFETKRRDLHLLNRMRYRMGRLAIAFTKRDVIGAFIEGLLWEQLVSGIEDEGPTARQDWRSFRRACRPSLHPGGRS